MNILLISQCEKRALVETRRILDQFAERRGERTWQTPITQAGLDTLRRLLRKTARKNTAVACHWIRGLDHSELLWIVGDASRFNAVGAVPTGTTTRSVLRGERENDWHTGETIRLLAAMGALLHDLGKACVAFQQRLKGELIERNQYRHEWISLRLFEAFVGGAVTDVEWLQRLADPSAADDATWLDRLVRDGIDAPTGKPLEKLPPLAQAVGWLVVTHHRLPVMPPNRGDGASRWLGAKVDGFRAKQLDGLPGRITAEWNELSTTNEPARLEPYWTFGRLPVLSAAWRKRASKLARRLIDLVGRTGDCSWLDDPYVMHLARLSLMLADHHYSALTDIGERERGDKGYPLYANTNRKTGDYNQPLDEHLIGVEKHAAIVAHGLSDFERNLPRLARHRGLRKRSDDERYRWQDRAADAAASIRERAARQGAFVVNMASTGCGKTLANARIMNALADPVRGMRCSFAMGLRTLTLQTGRAFRDRLNLSDDELAIRVGGAANRVLFEHYEAQAERSGSASNQALLDEDSHVFYEGDATHPVLQRALRDADVRALLAAPLLVCTVDHLVPATESQRGGRQIAPMLRLMSADLVLDELDDFDIDDVPALTRLAYWAGLLGTRVLLSSATLPPALVRGMFEAYLAGRKIFHVNRGETPGAAANVCCAWFDEFHQQTQDCADAERFEAAHRDYAKRRCEQLGRQAVRRRARVVELVLAGDRDALRAGFAEHVRDGALALHAAHRGVDPHSGKRVSFGLVRMANIDRLFDVALNLYRLGAPKGVRMHLCVYHSQFPLVIRGAIERCLDATLDRRKPDAVFDLPDIRRRLDEAPEPEQLFVVLGSPVTEVGRDHDYDWAVVEPSSMRSLIQLAGRVRRHRDGACVEPNIIVFSHNLRHYERRGQAAYCNPGYETSESDFRLADHDLRIALTEDERTTIDARPRIIERDAPNRNRNLVDLEHARMRDRTRALDSAESATLFWVRKAAHLCAVVQQHQPFRDQCRKEVDLVLLPNDDEDDYRLMRRDGKQGELEVDIDSNLNARIGAEQVRGAGIESWGAAAEYLEELARLAAEMAMPLNECARRFGTVTLPDEPQGWRFHPVLGFTKRR